MAVLYYCLYAHMYPDTCYWKRSKFLTSSRLRAARLSRLHIMQCIIFV